MKDIAPELIQKIKNEFDKKIKGSNKIKALEEVLKSGESNYMIANDYAIEVGDILADIFKTNLSSNILPDGRMYYNIAERLLNDRLKENYNLISEFTKETQTQINKKMGLNIKGVKSKVNQDRIDGIIDRISNEENYDVISWILDEPVKNFSQSIVDDSVAVNVKTHYNLGLKPRIIRKESGSCCDWCRKVVGKYEYPDVPDDIYKRHRYCRCTVEYDPGDGRKQNVHSKKWHEPEKDDKIEERKQASLRLSNKGERLANYLAVEEIKRLKKIEPKITKDLNKITINNKTKLEGLDFRIKSKESLSRKIISDAKEKRISLEEAVDKITDVLRYTSVSEDDTFTSSYFSILEDLKLKGYNVIRVKNTFIDEAPYKGVNTLVIDSQNNVFELQYHTPKSLEIKEHGLHDLYEKQRVLDKVRDKREFDLLESEMIKLSNKIPNPIDVERIK